MSTHDDDDGMEHASFLRASTATEYTTTSTESVDLDQANEPPPSAGNPVVPPENGVQNKAKDAPESHEDDEGDDEDERPATAPRARAAPLPSPFASGRARPAPPPQPPAHAQQVGYAPQQVTVEETLRVSEQCKARKCYRVRWEAEMNPRCREKTSLNVENKLYLFDGFYILCHDEVSVDVPQFEYTRGGVMCRIQLVREDLPRSLLPQDPNGQSTTTPEGCNTLFLLQRYLFQQLLGIQTPHLFQTIFADPTRATGDPGDICSDFHLIPRFISLAEQTLINREDLFASNRIGFAVGKLLPLSHVLGCLDANTKYSVRYYLDQFGAQPLIDTAIGTRINGVPCVFRVDRLLYEPEPDQPADQPNPEGPSPTKRAQTRQVLRVQHCGEGASQYDGAKGQKRLRKWQEQGGAIVQVSPRVDPYHEDLIPEECNLTGLRTDVFEVGSAMPVVLKYIRNYKLLASFESEMGLRFKDKALLRQAFTHGSYVDAGMQNVNTVEATNSRVRLGHVFENTNMLKRSRSAFLDDGITSATSQTAMDPEMKRISDQHLTEDFKPEFHSKYLCPYERLEFLGDAVLSFLVASSAFLKHPTAEEGQLHEIRKEAACNSTLGRIARAANFDMLILTAFDMARLNEDVKTKIAADCFEALLGAVFLDQGLEACRALLVNLLSRHDPELLSQYILTTEEVLEKAAAYVLIDRDSLQQSHHATELRQLHRKFSSKTNVTIRHTHLWVQCMTHNSFKAPQIDADEFIGHDPNYERIEFLGDAVLQLLSSAFLVDTFPNHQEHLLTQARSSLVKNTRLAVVARKAGYEDFIRLGKEARKTDLYMDDIFADVFEATLGAVFLENARDLSNVKSILERALFPLIKEAILRREWMSPTKIFQHHITQWSRQSNRPIECVFRKVPSVNTDQHCVALYVNNFRVARASGRTISAAKDAACRRALMLYGLKLSS
ncbi:hypothetical protein Poli38472_005502 [Pythium oligandrum]|uniref:RNase III domain-containing protein n=1 Tax=Pythium oligandrum TaxID=41045 RepID=A0A8K1CH07_PYTOL|nr:hypothetical protein Poli38472_005502 [Pythium oligandrum]|eukprot:TMW62884.1 hypothetical protein Poli38472_005502 [Pythium oligandrum]